MGWVKVASRAQLKPGEGFVVDAGDTRVALFDLGGAIYCIEDVCTHDDGPVAEGPVHGEVIECPRHGARFDIRTGAVLSMPAVVPVRTFPVTVKGEDVYIEID